MHDAPNSPSADDPSVTSSSALNRRDFFQRTGLAWAGAALGGSLLGSADARAQDREGYPVPNENSKQPPMTLTPLEERREKGQIPRRKFGKHDLWISAIGVGGFSIGGEKVPEQEGIAIVQEAVDRGVNFFDNAWEYNKHVSEERMGKALAEGGRRDKVFLMTKVCTHGRDAQVGMQQLEESLKRLRTDHLDLWQIHECVYWNDPERHFMKGGVIEALTKAKEQGKVRFVGFTGHKDPAIHLAMLAYDYPFDTCQLPLNVFDASFHSFEQRVLPELHRRGILPIGMKSLNGNARAQQQHVVSVEEALGYAMSLPVLTTVSGMDTLPILRENLQVATDFQRYPAEKMAALRQKFADNVASDGRFELYKTTNDYEASEGRAQHGFPQQPVKA
ncbi:MAG: aldo/keto reductase [Verrucomicrobia bacterium]|nr:aldo/keto reductase [Verrucomicrobiota bacterium]